MSKNEVVAIVLVTMIKAVYFLFSQMAPIQALEFVDGFWCMSHSF